MSGENLRKLARFLYQGHKRAKVNRRRLKKEMGEQAVDLRSHPMKLILEPATLCNLRCPFCPTGNGKLELKKELLLPENFYAMMSNLKPEYLFEANLYNWGEPLINPHILTYIQFFARRDIYTTIHTNFSVDDYNPDYFEALVESGLHELVASIDGARQQSYEKYRVGGNFDRALANMQGMARSKRLRKSNKPRIIYKMLLNRFNEKEVDEARGLAQSMGVEFRLDENFEIPPYVKQDWIASSVRKQYGDIPPTIGGRQSMDYIYTECRQLWDTAVVNANGDLLPCCLVGSHAMALGNLLKDPIATLWNSPKIHKLRRYVTDLGESPPEFSNLCVVCIHRYASHRTMHRGSD